MYYIDGVPSGNAFSLSTQLQQVYDIRMGLGPHPGKHGRIGSAATIEVNTLLFRPAPQLDLSLSVGTFNSYAWNLAINNTIAAGDYQLPFIFSFHGSREDGFVVNTFLDAETDTRDALGGSLHAELLNQNGWRVVAGISLDRFNDGSQRMVALAQPLNADGDFFLGVDVAGETNIATDQQTVIVTKNGESGFVQSITNRRFWELDPSRVDIDLSPHPVAVSLITQEFEEFSQELFFQTEPQERLHTKAGLFLSRSSSEGVSTRLYYGAPAVTQFELTELQASLYGYFNYMLTSQLRLQAGARVDHWAKDIDRVKVEVTQHVVANNHSKDMTELSPELELSYFLQPPETANAAGSRLYVRAARGLKPGGYAAYANDPQLADFDTEDNWSVEAGAQLDMLPLSNLEFTKSATLGIAGFHSRISDYQIERSISFADYAIINADEARISGVEAGLNIATTWGASMYLSYGYQNAEFEDFLFITGENLEGSAIPSVPEYTAGLLLSYDHPNNGLAASLEWRLTGEVFHDERNTGIFRQNSYDLIHASIGYRFDNGLELHLYGRNLEDERYYTRMISDLQAGVPGLPRQWGVKLNWSY